MNAQGALLAQVRPSVTSAVLGFAAQLRTEITLIVISNTTASAVNFSLYHDDNGTTYDQTTALYYAVQVAANSTELIQIASPNAGILLSSGGNLGVQSSTANALNFSIYGVTNRIYSNV